MLTKKDFDTIESIVRDQIKIEIDELRGEFDEKFVTKDEFKELNDTMITGFDDIVGQLKVISEEMTLIPHRLRDHEDRISKLEDIHPRNSHQTATV